MDHHIEPKYQKEREESLRGRAARSPLQMDKDGFLDVLYRVRREAQTDQIGLVAGGVAFFATLSLFPMLIALISLYGLLFSPADIAEQVQNLTVILPREASKILRDQLQVYLADVREGMGWGAFVGLLGSIFSASGGAATLLDALNIAYEEKERGFIRQRLLALGLALGGIALTIISLTLIALLPLILELMGLGALEQLWARSARWIALSVIFMTGLSIVYRVAPARRAARWRWVTYGALCATVIWIIASLGLAFFMEHLSGIGRTYGPLGGVYALMLWLYVTAYVVLLGAELNSELEAQTMEDSTIGPDRPLGERGAIKADQIGEERPLRRSKRFDSTD